MGTCRSKLNHHLLYSRRERNRKHVISLKNPSMGCLGSVRAAPLLGLLTLALAGCAESGETYAVRHRANVECVETTVDMRGDL